MKEKLNSFWKDTMNRKVLLLIILLTGVYLLDIFRLSRNFAMAFGGIGGTVAHEIFLALIGLFLVALFGGNVRMVYTFRKPQVHKVAGTLIMWVGTYLVTLLVTGIMIFFFPEEVTGASEGISDLLMTLPFLLSLFVVAVVPAVCEEMAFRGALLGCFRGGASQWIGLILVSLFFGACHGSIWRMIPTAILGFAMGYLLLETDNMFYNMLFHFTNNACPVIISGIILKLTQVMGGAQALDEMMEEAAGAATATVFPLSSVGVYMLLSGVGPFLIYIGNHLLHRNKPGYDRGMFPKEKRDILILMIVYMALAWMLGIALIVVGAYITGKEVYG